MKSIKNTKSLKIVLLALSLFMPVVACDTVPRGNVTPTPTLAARTQPTPTRPHLLIQYCDDDTGSYPHKYFPQANALIAQSLQDAVTANQAGVTLYATAITHNTFNPVNTLDPAFTIPTIPGYPIPPTPVPTHASENPVFDPATATTVSQQTINGIIGYNHSVAAIDQTLQTAKSTLAKNTGRLTTWNPSVDNIATSVLGCFQLAANRFVGQSSSIKMLYIASDLENNTDVDYTQNFVTAHALSGVIVHVIYFVSDTARRDLQKRTLWCPYLKSAGAATVLFSDPATPLQDIFDSDLTAPTLSC